MDWKPEKAVQAKVRDFNKQKQKQKMTVEACRGKNTLLSFTNGDFSQTFDRQWAGFPRGIGCHRVPGFIPPIARFIHNNSKEVCQVYILRYQSTSNLTCPVLFHRVTCHMQFIRSFKSQSYVHTCMHSCIQTSILSYIHTFKRAQRTHTHTISIHTWLHQSPRVLFCHISSNQSSILPSGKSYIADNLRFIFLSSKWLVLYNGQLEVYFSVFQVVSPT